jgi:aminoglycoside phosphotransferase (APT) family kinase protein
MHEGQLDVTVEVVAGLVEQQFPAWSELTVRAVPSHGTVNALFRIGDELVARFRIELGEVATVQQELEDEAEAARRLRALSPYPTPEPVAIGAPGPGYPLPWAVQSWVDGTIAYDADVAGSTAFAEDLARFVLALRAAPTEGRVFTGSWRGGVLTSQDEYVADGLARSRGMIDVDALSRLWAELRTTPRTEPDVWTHRDLMPGNLLVRDRRLAGVIDVGTFTVSDPAMDLQPVMSRTAHHTLTALLKVS